MPGGGRGAASCPHWWPAISDTHLSTTHTHPPTSHITYHAIWVQWNLNVTGVDAWTNASIGWTLDLQSPKLRMLASAMSPANLRIGGSPEDTAEYQGFGDGHVCRCVSLAFLFPVSTVPRFRSEGCPSSCMMPRCSKSVNTRCALTAFHFANSQFNHVFLLDNVHGDYVMLQCCCPQEAHLPHSSTVGRDHRVCHFDFASYCLRSELDVRSGYCREVGF